MSKGQDAALKIEPFRFLSQLTRTRLRSLSFRKLSKKNEAERSAQGRGKRDDAKVAINLDATRKGRELTQPTSSTGRPVEREGRGVESGTENGHELKENGRRSESGRGSSQLEKIESATYNGKEPTS